MSDTTNFYLQIRSVGRYNICTQSVRTNVNKIKRKQTMEQTYTTEELNEALVTKKELLKEIKTALKDYLKGKLKMCERGIHYTMPNGQEFIIGVRFA